MGTYGLAAAYLPPPGFAARIFLVAWPTRIGFYYLIKKMHSWPKLTWVYWYSIHFKKHTRENKFNNNTSFHITIHIKSNFSRYLQLCKHSFNMNKNFKVCMFVKKTTCLISLRCWKSIKPLMTVNTTAWMISFTLLVGYEVWFL